MSKFISHDRADSKGVRAEVSVDTGRGYVSKIVGAGSQKDDDSFDNYRVEFEATHVPGGLKFPVYGLIQAKDPLLDVCRQARSDKREVDYRLESQRKRKVDRAIPYETLASDKDTAPQNLVRILAGIDGVPSLEALTSPAEDSEGDGGRRSAIGHEGGGSAAPVGGGGPALSADTAVDLLGKARKFGFDPDVIAVMTAQALLAGANPNAVRDAGVQSPADAPHGVTGTVAAEEKPPFALYNSDGRLNLGSYAARAAFGADDFARELIAAHNLSLLPEGTEPSAPTEDDAQKIAKQALGLAGVLLTMADRVQVGAYGSGARPNRNANSHTRARALVYGEVKNDGVPFGADAATRTQWQDRIVERCVERFQAVARLALPGTAPVAAPVPEPRDAQAPAAPVKDEPTAAAAPVKDEPKAQVEAASKPVKDEPKAASKPAKAAPAEPKVEAAPAPAEPKVEAATAVEVAPENAVAELKSLAEKAGLFNQAGFPAITAILNAEFGVGKATDVDAELLAAFVSGYGTPDGADRFKADAEEAAGALASV